MAQTEPADPAAPLPKLTLVLGGARSGKSAYAEHLACDAGAGGAVYLATAEAGDDEMALRIAHHRQRRGSGWSTIEEPLDLANALTRAAALGQPVVVDCLTLWLSNLLAAGRDVEAETLRLTEALAGLAGPAILVTNEVGSGIVPATPLGRAFRDHAGRLNQAIAAVADRVVLVVAGLPLTIKG